MTTSSRRGTASRTRIQTAALAMGAVFVLVGLLGFVPGITSHYSDMSFAGHASQAKLLGLFQVSVLHNIVHLLFGVAGILAARTISGSRSYLVLGGAIYAILWIYGLIIDKNSGANFVPLNNADNWLHLILALAMIGAGLALSKDRGVARNA